VVITLVLHNLLMSTQTPHHRLRVPILDAHAFVFRRHLFAHSRIHSFALSVSRVSLAFRVRTARAHRHLSSRPPTPSHHPRASPPIPRGAREARVSLRRRTALAPCTSTSHASHKNTSAPNDTTHETRTHRQSTLASPSRSRRRTFTARAIPIAASESAHRSVTCTRTRTFGFSHSAFHARARRRAHTHRPPYKTPPHRARDTPHTSASNPRTRNQPSIDRPRIHVTRSTRRFLLSHSNRVEV